MDVKSSYMVLGGTALISLGVGVVSGYLFAKKQLEGSYIALANREIYEAKQFYATLHKRGRYSSPKSAVKDLIPGDEGKEAKAIRQANEAVSAIRDYRGESKHNSKNKNEEIAEVTDETPQKYVVTEDGFDFNEEMKHRSEDAPYVITHEEFFDDEEEHEKVTLTYFLEDGALCDRQDDVINDTDGIVGDDNLLRFGVGSGDPNIVYIRNEELDTDFEVELNKGSFGVQVHGFAHDDRSYRKRNKKTKFRAGDDE